MSAIATATVVPRSILGELREALTPRKPLLGRGEDRFPAMLARHGRSVGPYEWSGHALATLLPSLEERRGVRRMRSGSDDIAAALVERRGGTWFVLTHEHQRWLPDLDPSRFDVAELERYHADLTGTDGAGAGPALLDGVRFLRLAVAALDPTSVALLAIE